jgi:hypothetical protein
MEPKRAEGSFASARMTTASSAGETAIAAEPYLGRASSGGCRKRCAFITRMGLSPLNGGDPESSS